MWYTVGTLVFDKWPISSCSEITSVTFADGSHKDVLEEISLKHSEECGKVWSWVWEGI